MDRPLLEEDINVNVEYKPIHSQSWRDMVKVETIELWNIAIPSSISNFIEFVPSVFVLSIIGHLQKSQEKLDAVSLAISFFNVTCLSIGIGSISALRTVLPQSLGSEESESFRIYVQRAFLITVILSVPSFLLQFFSSAILKGLGQPQHIAEMAGQYSRRVFLSYFGIVWFSICQCILQSKARVWPNVAVSSFICILAPFLVFVFVHWFNMGYLGAAWAVSVYGTLQLVLLATFMVFSEFRSLFQLQSLNKVFKWDGLVEYGKLALPGLLSTCLEWWVLEITSILAGLLPNAKVTLGASYILFNIDVIIFMTYLGILSYASVRIGYFIGRGDIAAAKFTAFLSICISVLLAGIVCLLVVFLRHHIAQIYSNDPEIQQLTANLLLVLSAFLPFDAINSCLSGIMSGLGLQRYAALCQVVGFYLVGMPIGIILVFAVKVDHGVYWLWGGVGISMFTSAFMGIVILIRHDWKSSIEECSNRLLVEKPS